MKRKINRENSDLFPLARTNERNKRSTILHKEESVSNSESEGKVRYRTQTKLMKAPEQLPQNTHTGELNTGTQSQPTPGGSDP